MILDLYNMVRVAIGALYMDPATFLCLCIASCICDRKLENQSSLSRALSLLRFSMPELLETYMRWDYFSRENFTEWLEGELFPVEFEDFLAIKF